MTRRQESWLPANGECPVHHSAWIDKVEYRSGDIATAECRASAIDWKHDRWFPMVDIVAYLPERRAPENHETQCVRCGAPLWPNEPCPVCMNALATGAQQSSDNSLQLTESQCATDIHTQGRDH